MPSGDDSPPASRPKVVIVCLAKDIGRIRRIIATHAGQSWEREQAIQLMPVLDEFTELADGSVRFRRKERHSRIKSRLEKRLAIEDHTLATRVLFVGLHHLSWRSSSDPDDNRDVRFIPTPEELDSRLPAFLETSGVDWKTNVLSKLANHDAGITRDQFDRWCRQFDLLGVPWIAEKLLLMLDFWTLRRTSDELLLPPKHMSSSEDAENWLESFDYITFRDPASGSSGAVMARVMKKWRPTLRQKSKPFPEVAALCEHASQSSPRILFLDDCIMTGKQASDLLAKPMYAALRTRVSLSFKVAVATSYGRYAVLQAAKNAGWTSVEVVEPSAGFIPNMSPEASDAAARGHLFQYPQRLRAELRAPIPGFRLPQFRDVMRSNQRKEVDRFCRRIGSQLMFHHFQGEGFEPASATEKARENSLGFGNLGMLVVFAFAVPDNVLPLFWCSGQVSENGVVLDWMPLFRTR